MTSQTLLSICNEIKILANTHLGSGPLDFRFTAGKPTPEIRQLEVRPVCYRNQWLHPELVSLQGLRKPSPEPSWSSALQSETAKGDTKSSRSCVADTILVALVSELSVETPMILESSRKLIQPTHPVAPHSAPTGGVAHLREVFSARKFSPEASNLLLPMYGVWARRMMHGIPKFTSYQKIRGCQY